MFKLINDAKSWYKLWSVWVFALIGFYQWLETNWTALHSLVPEQYQGYLTILLSALGILARLVAQPSLSKE